MRRRQFVKTGVLGGAALASTGMVSAIEDENSQPSTSSSDDLSVEFPSEPADAAQEIGGDMSVTFDLSWAIHGYGVDSTSSSSAGGDIDDGNGEFKVGASSGEDAMAAAYTDFKLSESITNGPQDLDLSVECDYQTIYVDENPFSSLSTGTDYRSNDYGTGGTIEENGSVSPESTKLVKYGLKTLGMVLSLSSGDAVISIAIGLEKAEDGEFKGPEDGTMLRNPGEINTSDQIIADESDEGTHYHDLASDETLVTENMYRLITIVTAQSEWGTSNPAIHSAYPDVDTRFGQGYDEGIFPRLHLDLTPS